MTRVEYSDGYYSGGMQNNKRNGNGVYNFLNGDSFDGNWEDDLPEGPNAAISYSNGNKFNGSMKKGFLDDGVFKFASNNSYEGKFKNNQFHGNGKFEWSDGTCYEGKGILKTSDRTKIIGNFDDWSQKSRSGSGIFIEISGTVSEKIFKDGKEVSNVVFTEENNSLFKLLKESFIESYFADFIIKGMNSLEDITQERSNDIETILGSFQARSFIEKIENSKKNKENSSSVPLSSFN